MMQLNCPYCGLRDEREFTWGGEAYRERPRSPELASDTEWADYLYTRRNPRGKLTERWCHTHGCGQWCLLVRDTATHELSPLDDLQRRDGGAT